MCAKYQISDHYFHRKHYDFVDVLSQIFDMHAWRHLAETEIHTPNMAALASATGPEHQQTIVLTIEISI